MKYEYKTITTKGINDFKDYKSKLIKMYQAKRIASTRNTVILQADLFERLVHENEDGFSYIKNLAEKYGYSKLDYLNFFAAQGWKVITYTEANEKYLLEREISGTKTNDIEIPEFKESDLQLEQYEISFICNVAGVTVPDPKLVEAGYLLTPADYPKKAGFKTELYLNNEKVDISNFEVQENTQFEIRFSRIPNNNVKWCN